LINTFHNELLACFISENKKDVEEGTGKHFYELKNNFGQLK
jgi:hypothetical protein